MDRDELKHVIERAGAAYVSESAGSVYFVDRQTGATVSLFVSGVRDVTDIEMALRRVREQRLAEGWASRI